MTIKKCLTLFFLLVFLKIISAPAFATNITPTPSPTQDSYTLFYPIVAGKTEGESMYFLKSFRDGLTEFLAFDSLKKSTVLLNNATKRILESEKLYKESKDSLANKTLNKFLEKIGSSYDLAIKDRENDLFPDLITKIQTENNKYEILLNQMLKVSPANKETIQKSLDKVIDIKKKVSEEFGE